MSRKNIEANWRIFEEYLRVAEPKVCVKGMCRRSMRFEELNKDLNSPLTRYLHEVSSHLEIAEWAKLFAELRFDAKT